MLLKRNHSYKTVFIITTIIYAMLMLSLLMIIVSTLAGLKEYIKVPGLYKENTIIYTTLDNNVVELEDKTINIYEENEEIFVYYHKDDIKKIKTSTLVHNDIANSITFIVIFSTPYCCFVILIFNNKIKQDKNIIKNGKKIRVNISDIVYDADKIFGKYMIIKAKYTNENKKSIEFLSDKIYNDKQMSEIKSTGSVDVYYLEDDINRYVRYIVYQYYPKPTIEW
jgi:hypothetical protein